MLGLRTGIAILVGVCKELHNKNSIAELYCIIEVCIAPHSYSRRLVRIGLCSSCCYNSGLLCSCSSHNRLRILNADKGTCSLYSSICSVNVEIRKALGSFNIEHKICSALGNSVSRV